MQKTLLLVLIASIAAAVFLGYELQPNLRISATATPTATPTVLATLTPTPSLMPVTEAEKKLVVLKLPAIDQEGKGVLADLVIEARKGEGRIFIQFNEDSPIVNNDTQQSLRTAIRVAKEIGGEISKWDLYYGIITVSPTVAGGSAGAAMSVATLSLIKESKLRKDTIITGSVQEDGSIGKVGRVLEKARAVKEAGYARFLVPQGESKQTVYVEKCKEERTATSIVKQCITTPEEVDIAKEVGIQLIEVENIAQAYNQMTEV